MKIAKASEHGATWALYLILAFAMTSMVFGLFWFLPPRSITIRFIVYLALAVAWGLTLLPSLFLSYAVTEEGLLIRAGLRRRMVRFAEIQQAWVEDLKPGMRIFGNNGPGFSVGRFRFHGLGEVQLYASRNGGPSLVVETSDGERLVLTPARPEAALDRIYQHLPPADRRR